MNGKKVSILIVVLLMFGLLMTVPVFSESPKSVEPSAIALNQESVELAKGKQIKLAVTATGDKIPPKPVFKWQSSDNKIATVQNGSVKGVAAGTATITVTLKIDENTQLSASCEIHVHIPVSKITTKDKSIKLDVGWSFTPTVTVTPKTATNQTLLWKSDTESIATVSDKGVIRAVNGGECTITATTTDGSNKTLSIKVFVPTLSATKNEVNLQIFSPSIVRVKYFSDKSCITLDDNNARNNWYIYDFKDRMLEIRIWPWGTGTSTLTISDSSSPESTVKIKIVTGRHAGLNSREAFPNINNYYKGVMRYGVSGYINQYLYVKARVMQAYNGDDSAWILAYSKGKYDDLVYIEYPLKSRDDLPYVQRVQEDDIIHVYATPSDIYSYETTRGATNYALQLKPYLMLFDDGGIFYLDKDIYK